MFIQRAYEPRNGDRGQENDKTNNEQINRNTVKVFGAYSKAGCRRFLKVTEEARKLRPNVDLGHRWCECVNVGWELYRAL